MRSQRSETAKFYILKQLFLWDFRSYNNGINITIYSLLIRFLCLSRIFIKYNHILSCLFDDKIALFYQCLHGSESPGIPNVFSLHYSLRQWISLQQTQTCIGLNQLKPDCELLCVFIEPVFGRKVVPKMWFMTIFLSTILFSFSMLKQTWNLLEKQPKVKMCGIKWSMQLDWLGSPDKNKNILLNAVPGTSNVLLMETWSRPQRCRRYLKVYGLHRLGKCNFIWKSTKTGHIYFSRFLREHRTWIWRKNKFISWSAFIYIKNTGFGSQLLLFYTHFWSSATSQTKPGWCTVRSETL